MRYCKLLLYISIQGVRVMRQFVPIIAIFLSFTLTACSKEDAERKAADVITTGMGQYREVFKKDEQIPPPAMPEIISELPVTLQEIADNRQYINSRIHEIDGKTKIYFAKKDGKFSVVNRPEDAQYYRLILGKTADGHYAVADFYINGKPHKEPLIIRDEKRFHYPIFTGDEIEQKVLVAYDEEGNINVVQYPLNIAGTLIPTKRFEVFKLKDNGKSILFRDYSQSTAVSKEFFFNADGTLTAVYLFEVNPDNSGKYTFFRVNPPVGGKNVTEQYEYFVDNQGKLTRIDAYMWKEKTLIMKNEAKEQDKYYKEFAEDVKVVRYLLQKEKAK